MAKLGELHATYCTETELRAKFGQPAEPCAACGCSVMAILHTGEIVCGECGPTGRAASTREVAYLGIVVVDPDGRQVLADLGAEQERAARERDEIDLSPRGHGRWRRVAGGWRRVA